MRRSMLALVVALVPTPPIASASAATLSPSVTLDGKPFAPRESIHGHPVPALSRAAVTPYALMYDAKGNAYIGGRFFVTNFLRGNQSHDLFGVFLRGLTPSGRQIPAWHLDELGTYDYLEGLWTNPKGDLYAFGTTNGCQLAVRRYSAPGGAADGRRKLEGEDAPHARRSGCWLAAIAPAKDRVFMLYSLPQVAVLSSQGSLRFEELDDLPDAWKPTALAWTGKHLILGASGAPHGPAAVRLSRMSADGDESAAVEIKPIRAGMVETVDALAYSEHDRALYAIGSAAPLETKRPDDDEEDGIELSEADARKRLASLRTQYLWVRKLDLRLRETHGGRWPIVIPEFPHLGARKLIALPGGGIVAAGGSEKPTELPVRARHWLRRYSAAGEPHGVIPSLAGPSFPTEEIRALQLAGEGAIGLLLRTLHRSAVARVPLTGNGLGKPALQELTPPASPTVIEALASLSTKDSTFLAGGGTDLVRTDSSRDWWVQRFDRPARFVWSKSFDRGAYEEPLLLLEARTDRLLVVGRTEDCWHDASVQKGYYARKPCLWLQTLAIDTGAEVSAREIRLKDAGPLALTHHAGRVLLAEGGRLRNFGSDGVELSKDGWPLPLQLPKGWVATALAAGTGGAVAIGGRGSAGRWVRRYQLQGQTLKLLWTRTSPPRSSDETVIALAVTKAGAVVASSMAAPARGRKRGPDELSDDEISGTPEATIERFSPAGKPLRFPDALTGLPYGLGHVPSLLAIAGERVLAVGSSSVKRHASWEERLALVAFAAEGEAAPQVVLAGQRSRGADVAFGGSGDVVVTGTWWSALGDVGLPTPWLFTVPAASFFH